MYKVIYSVLEIHLLHQAQPCHLVSVAKTSPLQLQSSLQSLLIKHQHPTYPFFLPFSFLAYPSLHLTTQTDLFTPPFPPASLINSIRSALLTLNPLSLHPFSPPHPSQAQETIIIIRTAPSNPFLLILSPSLSFSLPPSLKQADPNPPPPPTPPPPPPPNSKHNLVIDTHSLPRSI